MKESRASGAGTGSRDCSFGTKSLLDRGSSVVAQVSTKEDPLRLPRLGRALPLAVALFVIAAGGVAWATIPDSSGAIHACRDTSTGALRVIDPSTGGACSTGKEAELDWNQTGPAGPAGSPGAAGPTGPSGPASPSAVYETDPSPLTWHDISTRTQTVSLPLPPGSYAVTAHAELIADGQQQAYCTLDAVNASADTQSDVEGDIWVGDDAIVNRNQADTAGIEQVLPLQMAMTLTSPGGVDLSCFSYAHTSGERLAVSNMRVMAVSVGSVSHFTPPSPVAQALLDAHAPRPHINAPPVRLRFRPSPIKRRR